MVKTKLKYVIPTFFTCLVQILAARTERSFLLGWSAPRLTLGTEPCARVDRSSPTRCFARGQIDRRVVRNRLSTWHLLDRQGDREVTDMVICVSHAPVTLSRCK
jgi:hypothetical protein